MKVPMAVTAVTAICFKNGSKARDPYLHLYSTPAMHPAPEENLQNHLWYPHLHLNLTPTMHPAPEENLENHVCRGDAMRRPPDKNTR